MSRKDFTDYSRFVPRFAEKDPDTEATNADAETEGEPAGGAETGTAA